jgi:hypothetical protein
MLSSADDRSYEVTRAADEARHRAEDLGAARRRRQRTSQICSSTFFRLEGQSHHARFIDVERHVAEGVSAHDARALRLVAQLAEMEPHEAEQGPPRFARG